ncbi:MAG: hypothetical protein KDA83_07395 [Planctomycetales bacterium]|nr:hypothetical protein [Planctomycetales bacterium]
MFSLRERLLAWNGWSLVGFVGSLVVGLLLLIESVDLSATALRSLSFVMSFLGAMAAALLLAIVLSPFVSFVLFSGLVERQVRRNGGPFKVGDRVVIIPGRQAGLRATISSFGQCRSLGITIDGELTERLGYSARQLKLVNEPMSSTESPHQDSP